MRKFLLAMVLVLAFASMVFAQQMDTPVQFKMDSNAIMGSGLKATVTEKNHYKVECVRDGKVIWTEEFDNLVPTAGLSYLLTAGFKSAGSTTWYVALVGSTSTGFVAGDTSASHAAWTEITGYTNTVRPTLTLGAVSSGSVDNSASTAQFTMTGSTTVYGAAIIDSLTKGTGVGTGGLYGEGAFSTSRAVVANDVLNVTITLTVTASPMLEYISSSSSITLP